MKFVLDNIHWILAAFVSGGMLLWPLARRGAGGPWVSTLEATQLMNREDALVIDVRSQAEYEKGHIIGARHVLPSQVEPGHKLLANATEKPVVIVCAAGMNASAIAARLVKAGFRNAGVLDGGVGAWQAAGLPLVRGKA